MPRPLLALALLAQAAAPAAPAAPPPPPPSAAVVAAPDAGSEDVPTVQGLEDLKRVYADSCLTRAYGTYDEVCSQLADRVRAYRREVARQQKRRPGG